MKCLQNRLTAVTINIKSLLAVIMTLFSSMVIAHGGVEIEQTPDKLLIANVINNPINDSTIMVVSGLRPALMISHSGEHPLAFLDNETAWLVFTQQGVFANADSSKWSSFTADQQRGATNISARQATQLNLPIGQWKQIKTKPHLTYLEPELAKTNPAMRWHLPFVYQGQTQQLDGSLYWQKIEAPKKTHQSGH